MLRSSSPEAWKTSSLPVTPHIRPFPRPGCFVLIADDCKDLRDLMRRVVERFGHVVDEAEDGQCAVEAIVAQRYDLLLLDLSMPRMSGIDVARWLHAHPEQQDGMTVAVVSASAHDERPTLNELGVGLLLPKPLRRQELADLIHGLPGGS